jgi:hypothetical protein
MTMVGWSAQRSARAGQDLAAERFDALDEVGPG